MNVLSRSSLIFGAALSLVFITGCVSQPKNVETSSQSFLWKISRPGMEQPSWLFGTIHVGVAAQELPVEVSRAFTGARTLVAEADVTRDDTVADQTRELLEPSRGPHLSQQVKPATWSLLKARLVPPFTQENLDKLSPAMANLMLLNSMTKDCSSCRQVGRENVLDYYYIDHAKKMNKRIIFLESIAEQVKMLSSLLTPQALDSLAETMQASPKALDRLVREYKNGDENGVNRALSSLDAKESQVLLENRNAAWEARVADCVAQSRCFVAVGVGHMLGRTGLVQRLQKKGYTVVRASSVD